MSIYELQKIVIRRAFFTINDVVKEQLTKIDLSIFTDRTLQVLAQHLGSIGNDDLNLLARYSGISRAVIDDLKDEGLPLISFDAALKNLQDAHQDYSSGTRLFISATEMLSKRIIVRPLVGKLIERGTTGQIFGPPASGKSFIGMDMGLCVATGSAWNGHPCERGAVLYFAGEGHMGLIRRMKAWHLAHGTFDSPPFFSSHSTITLDHKGLDQVIAEGLELQEQTAHAISLIIIDTLARHLQGDENSAREMGEFVRMIDGLRNTFPGSTAIIIHHTGNDPES